MYSESTRSFESNKMLGGVGALLTAVGSLPLGPIGVVAIVGIILLLISLRGLTDDFKEPAIWKNALSGVIFAVIAIIAGIVGLAFLFGSIISVASLGVFGLGLGVLEVIVGIVGLITAFVFYVLAATNLRRAFDILGQKSGEGIFHTGGLLLFIGAILTIIVVGFVLLAVAWLLLAVAFFSMKPLMTAVPTYATPYVQPPQTGTTSTAQVKYCPNCGAENRLDATFCTHCGRKLSN